MKIVKDKNVVVIEKEGLSESFLNLKNFKYIMLKMISESKFDIVFKSTYSRIEIKPYFVTEAIFLLEWYLTSQKQGYKDFSKEILELLYTVNDVKDHTKIEDTLDYKQIDSKMNFKILPHQKKAFINYLKVKYGYNLRGYLLEAGIGSGKTFSSLALSEALHSEIRIIICQAVTISEVWEPSLTGDMYKDKAKRPLFIVRDKGDYNKEKDIICNYEQINKVIDIIKDIPKGKVTIIVDEIHKFNDVTGKSQRPITLHRLIEKVNPDDLILLSGTPIKYSPKEMTNLLRLLDPKFTRKVEKLYNEFYKRGGQLAMFSARHRYSTLRVKIAKTEMELPPLVEQPIKITLKNGDYYTITAIRERLRDYTKKRLRELNGDMDLYRSTYEALRNKAYDIAVSNSRTTKQDYTVYKMDIEIIIKMYKKNQLGEISTQISRANEYEKKVLLPELVGDEKVAFKDAKSVVKYVSLKVAGEAIGKIVTRARRECAIDLVRTLDINKILSDSSKKVIFFTKFVPVADEVYKGRKSYITPVYGEHLKNFKENMKEFRDGHKKKAISATYASLSTGTPVTEANTIILCDLVYLDFEYKQAIGRAHRLGQDETVYVYNLVLDTTDTNITNRDIDIMDLTTYNSTYITGLDSVLDTIPETKDTAVLQPKEFIAHIRNNLVGV